MKHILTILILGSLPLAAGEKVSERAAMTGAQIDGANDLFGISDMSVPESKKITPNALWDYYKASPTFTGTMVVPTIYATDISTTSLAAVGSVSVPNGSFVLSKLAQTGATGGQVPMWNGSAWAPATPGGTWGAITGTLSSQTDLDTALSGKMANTSGAVAAVLPAAIAEDPAAVRAAAGFHVIMATDYGAVFDGETDDTDALNAAFAAAAAATGPSEVVMPPGTAVVSGTLIIRGRDGLRIRGSGPWVTGIVSTSNTDNVFQYRQPNNGQLAYLEFLELADFSVTGTGIPNSTATGIHLHDDTTSDDRFNGGSLVLKNLRIGANGTGFHTGLFLKRWDTFTIENCRILYNYRNARLEKFTKTGTVINGGNAQAESVLWDIGPGARVNFMGVDNGNAPQWFRIGEGATATNIGLNHETQRYSATATRKFNYATSTYPTVANITAITDGVFTTGASHGFKPGMSVALGCLGSPTAFPSPLNFIEMYEVAETSFDATHFTLLPVERYGTVAVGSSDITVSASGQRANYNDLAVGMKVRVTTEGIANVVIAYTGGELAGGDRLPAADYWIVAKPSSTTIQISETEGGDPIVFQTVAGVHLRPLNPILPVALGSGMTAFAPPIALLYAARLTEIDCQHTANSGVPFVVVGTGCSYHSLGSWHTSGFTTAGLTGQAATVSALFSGRVLSIGLNTIVDGLSVPVTTRIPPNDGTITTYTTGRKYTNNSDSGFNFGNTEYRTGEYWVLGKNGSTGVADRAFKSIRDKNGLFAAEPFLNRDIVRTIAVTSATFATYSELKPRQKYRIDHSTASATLVLNLPDNSTTGTYSYDGLHTDERISVDDEIEVMVVGANGQTVEIHQGTASGTIRLNSSTVTTAGTTHGISMVAGESVRLKATSVAGANVGWQVVGGVGAYGVF